MSDRIQELVTVAHAYFNETLTSSMVAMDKESAVAYFNEWNDHPYHKEDWKIP